MKTKRRLLIVGCGDVVRRALPQLLRRWQVIALVRRRDPELHCLGVRQIVGDLDRPDTLLRLAGIADAVLHSAPPPTEGREDPRTKRLLACLGRSKSVPRCMVYIGTTGVYGDCGGALIDETRPLRPRSARAWRRVSAERQLRAYGCRNGWRGCRVSLLRAPGIYAADRMPLERLQRGLPLLHADEDAYTNHIHAEDLARACVHALERGRSNRAVNVVDDTDLRMAEWFDLLAQRYGLPRAPRASWAEMQQRLSPMQLSFMGESRRIGNRRLRRELCLDLRYPTVHAGIDAALAVAAPSSSP